MIRPELIQRFKKYREVIAAVFFAFVGIWVMSWGVWFWQGVGALVLLTGAALAYTALRRMRFQTDQVGPGVVEVDERQISYFSAYEGGAVSIEALARITCVTTDTGPWAEDLHWVLEEDGGSTLTIPNSAAGTEKLFDAFAALPGVDYAKATKAMESTENDSYVSWAKPRTSLH